MVICIYVFFQFSCANFNYRGRSYIIKWVYPFKILWNKKDKIYKSSVLIDKELVQSTNFEFENS